MSKRTIRILLLVAGTCAALLAFAPGAMAHSWRGDRNHDRIPDRWERANHLSLKVNQAKRGQDHDGLRNRGEFLAGDNPRNADTDDDGIEDGRERAGTVVSFTGGVLILHLFNGDDVKGIVDDNTELTCEGAGPTAARVADHGKDKDEDDNDEQANCGASLLTPGAIVGEAELRATAGGLVFREIELVL